MSAPLDWLMAYEAARSGAFGDQSQSVIDRIKEVAGSDFQMAIDKGYIKEPKPFEKRTVNNESGEQEQDVYDFNSVDWSKAPKIGITAPKGYTIRQIEGRAGSEFKGSDYGVDQDYGLFHDPNYGDLAISRFSSKDPWYDQAVRAVALTGAGGALGIGLAGGLGLASGTLGNAAVQAGVRAGENAMFANKQPSALSIGLSFVKPAFADFIKG